MMTSDGNHRKDAVEAKIRTLEQADAIALRAEWRRLVGGDPPRLSRDLLVRALAYQIQERAFDGLSRASLKHLQAAARKSGDATPPSLPANSLRPGAKLVREWYGRTHVVIATETGFDYAGETYRSLTQIAKLITGAHWSGPRFFGLTAKKPGRRRADG